MKQVLIRRVVVCSVLLLVAGCFEENKPVAHGPTEDPNLTDQAKFEKGKDEPITANTHFAAGQLAETRGDNETAIAQYRAALKLEPRHQASLYRMAVLQTQLKQYPQAIATWKSYVLATNEAAGAYGNLGFCYQVAGRPNEAEQAYLRGISRDPKESSCRVNYGLMLATESRAAEALEQFQAVLSPAEAHYNLGSVYEQQGHKEQAKVEYRKALSLDANMFDAQKRLDAMK